MKSITNIIISHAIFLGIFGVAAMALAQEPEASTTPPIENIEERFPERQEDMRGRRDQIASTTAAKRTGIAETVAERRVQLEDKAQTRITNLAANISNRMDAMVSRLQNITNRIESRIAKLKENGVDTSEAEASLASAQLSIDAAAAAIADVDSQVADVVGSEDVRAAWEALKMQYASTKDHLKTAHTELRNTVTALKAARDGERPAQNRDEEPVDNTLEDTNEATE